jgi:hypothetical protein
MHSVDIAQKGACASSEGGTRLEDVSIYQMGKRALCTPADIIESFVHAIERNILWEPGGQPKFAQVCADFVKDAEGNWWLLQVKSIKFHRKPSKVMNNRGLSQEMPNKSISRSAPQLLHKQGGDSNVLLNRSTKMGTILLQQALGCELCGLQGFEKGEMFTMSSSMISRMLTLFEWRGIHLRCLSSSKIPLLIKKGFGKFRVCRMCYEIYKAQENLMSIGQEYQNLVRFSKKKKRQNATRNFGITHVGEGPTLDLLDKEPKNEEPNLFKFTIVLFLHSIFGFEGRAEKRQVAHGDFTVDYTFGHTKFQGKLSPSVSGEHMESDELPMQMLSVHQLYAKSSSMLHLLKVRTVNINLYHRTRVSEKRICEAQISFPLKQLVFGVMNNRDMKHDILLPVKTRSLGDCWASMSIGLLNERKKGGCSVEGLSSQRSYLNEDGIYWEVDNEWCTDLLPSEWLLESASKSLGNKVPSALFLFP